MENYDSTHTGAQIDDAVGKVRNPDSTPTASSAALVTSGGVRAAIEAEAARAMAEEVLKAPIYSPEFVGTPKAPTASAGTNSTQIATTAFVKTAVGAEATRAQAAEALLAPLDSPQFSGIPRVPDASAAANSSQIANTRFVKSVAAGKQDVLTFDTAPTSGSVNPVTSSGVFAALSEDVTFSFEASGIESAGSSGRVTKIGRMVFFDFYVCVPTGTTLPANTHLISIDAVMIPLPGRTLANCVMANASRQNLTFPFIKDAFNYYLPLVIVVPRPSYSSTALVSSPELQPGSYYLTGFFEV